jgi:hypothetical protein
VLRLTEQQQYRLVTALRERRMCEVALVLLIQHILLLLTLVTALQQPHFWLVRSAAIGIVTD